MSDNESIASFLIYSGEATSTPISYLNENQYTHDELESILRVIQKDQELREKEKFRLE